MMNLIITTSESRRRAVGWARNEYSNDGADEEPVSCAEEDITAAFKRARDAGHSLAGVDKSIGAAVEDPLDFTDFLTVDNNGSPQFNAAYSRGSDSSDNSA